MTCLATRHSLTVIASGLVWCSMMTPSVLSATTDPPPCDPVDVLQHPADETVLPGEFASFEVSVTGPANGFHWRHNLTPLSDDGRITGAATRTLTISGIGAGDQGRYDCVITGGCQDVTSNAAELSCKTTFLIDPIGGTFPGGRVIKLSGFATQVHGVTYHWYKDGLSLSNSGVFSGVTTARLTIYSVGAEQSGVYTVGATNACGESFSGGAQVTIVCGADFNGDTFLTYEDFDAFVQAFEAGQAASDFNGDGFLTFEDFDAFVAAFEAGC